jgi:hypothetical protein
MAAVAAAQPRRMASRRRRLAVERVMTEFALAGPHAARARSQRIGRSTRTAKPRPALCPASNFPP